MEVGLALYCSDSTCGICGEVCVQTFCVERVGWTSLSITRHKSRRTYAHTKYASSYAVAVVCQRYTDLL